jgi:hypothetical protein
MAWEGLICPPAEIAYARLARMGRQEDLLNQIDDVIAKGKAAIETPRRSSTIMTTSTGQLRDFQGTSDENSWVDEVLGSRFRTAGLTLLYNMFTEHSPVFKDFNEWTGKNTRSFHRRALGTIEAVRENVVNGWLIKTRALIAADIFSNILEMAGYLLAEGYKDPAAVMIGASLEGHLRNLADRNSIPTTQGSAKPKKADMLNADLKAAGVYELGDQKQVTAWLDLRNNAAHGHTTLYTKEQVELMLQGVQNFIVRVPA